MESTTFHLYLQSFQDVASVVCLYYTVIRTIQTIRHGEAKPGHHTGIHFEMAPHQPKLDGLMHF